MTMTPLTEQQLDEYAQLIARTAPSGAAVASPGMGAALLAEVHRLQAALAKEELLHGDTIDGRDRAQDAADKLAYAVASEDVIGEHTADNSPWANALDLIAPKTDVDRLRDRVAELEVGLNDLAALVSQWYGRSTTVEATLDRGRRIASRLAAHAVGFQDVLDESDRGPWGRTVGADIAELSAALSPDTGTEDTAGHEGDSEALPTAYVVSCLPEGHDERLTYTINVQYRGDGLYAIVRNALKFWGTDGTWQYEPNWDNEDGGEAEARAEEKWLAAHRFGHDEALRLAREIAPTLTYRGRTVADALAEEVAR